LKNNLQGEQGGRKDLTEDPIVRTTGKRKGKKDFKEHITIYLVGGIFRNKVKI